MARLLLWSSTGVVGLVLVVLSLAFLDAGEAAGACDAKNEALLASWDFDGTYDDTSRNQRGPAIGAWDRQPVGGNINLQWPSDQPCAGYVHVGNPGYLEVPRVDFHNISFTLSVSVKLNGGQIKQRRILYADWNTNEWQFMSFVNPDGSVTVWFRNGAQQTFVDRTSTRLVPVGVWTQVSIVWDRPSRTASIYINKLGAGHQVVAANVNDIDLCKSSTYYYQLGAKADSTDVANDYAPLDADVRDLRVYKGFDLSATPQGQGLGLASV